MMSNVHALELGRTPKRGDVGRPDRTDVETALQAVVSLEREADRIKRALGEAKKALSRALHN